MAKKRYASGGRAGGINPVRGEPEDQPITVTGRRSGSFNLADLPPPSGRGMIGPSMPSGGGDGGTSAPARSYTPTRTRLPFGRTAGFVGPTFHGEDGERLSMGIGPRRSIGAGLSIPFKKGGTVKKMAKGGKLTDLTGDGKVTRADVLKGRGVPGFSKGGTASKRADGCATKGKTKGRFV